MVKIDSDGVDLYLDGILKDNLDYVKPHVLKDWDMCFIFSGIEGGGKSTFCFQVARYLAGARFTLDHVCFGPKEFMEKIRRPNFLQPGDCLVLDESFMINSRSTMSELNRRFLAILSECRQKQLFLLINVPNFFDLDKNLALWRSRGLFYIYHDSFQRGFFKYFNYEKKKKLFIQGKKFFNYNCVKPDFLGRFTKVIPFDHEEYKKAKLTAFEVRVEDELSPKQLRYTRQRNILVELLHNKGMSYEQMAVEMRQRGIKITAQSLCEGGVSVREKDKENNNKLYSDSYENNEEEESEE